MELKKYIEFVNEHVEGYLSGSDATKLYNLAKNCKEGIIVEIYKQQPLNPPLSDFRTIRYYTIKEIEIILKDKFEILSLKKHKTKGVSYHMIVSKKI